MVENCWGGSGYSAETPGRIGFKGLKKANQKLPWSDLTFFVGISAASGGEPGYLKYSASVLMM